MAGIPDSHKDILESKGFAHVATIGPDGAPQCTPVWFDWDGKQVRFSQTTTRQKYRNLQRDQRVALSIQDPSNPYRMIEVRGKAEFTEDSDRKFVDAMAKRYMDQDTYPYDQPGDVRMIVSVKPEHVTVFGE